MSALAIQDESKALASTSPASVIEAIIAIASNPQMDVAKIAALVKLQEHMEERQAKKEYGEAMARLQPRIGAIAKRGKRVIEGKLHNTFAKYEDVMDEVGPLLGEEGFYISFDSIPCDKGTDYSAQLTHRGGHSETRHVIFPPDKGGSKNDIQAIVSSGTYAQRTLLKMLVNFVTKEEDKDGEMPRTGSTITESQADQILTLCAQVGWTTPAMRVPLLNWLKVKRIEDIQASDYDRAEKELIRKAKEAK